MPDYGASGGGMGQMIQMIAALSDMQTKKRELALREHEHKTQIEQFTKTFGLSEDQLKNSKIDKILEQIMNGSSDAQQGAKDLAKLRGLSDAEAELFAHIAPSATAAQQIFNLQQQRSGLASMSPADQQISQQNAYLAQQTQGNRGTQATGELIAGMAGNNNPQAAFGKDMMARLGEGYAIRAATGQDPFQFRMSQEGIRQNMAGAAQSIAAGLTPSAGQILGAQTQNTATLAGLSEAEIRARAAGGNRMAPADYASMINQLRETTKAFADPKNASTAAKEQLKQQYNSLARVLGLGIITDDAQIPGAVGLIDQLWNKIQGGQVPMPAAPGNLQMPVIQMPIGAPQ